MAKTATAKRSFFVAHPASRAETARSHHQRRVGERPRIRARLQPCRKASSNLRVRPKADRARKARPPVTPANQVAPFPTNDVTARLKTCADTPARWQLEH